MELPAAMTWDSAPALYKLLQGSVSGNGLATCTRILEAAEAVSGFCLVLLEMMYSHTPPLKPSERQVAIICVKNTIRRHWSEGRALSAPRSAGVVPPEERVAIRQKLLELVATEPDAKVAAHIIVAISKIARASFPNEWPDLFEVLLAGLTAAHSTWCSSREPWATSQLLRSVTMLHRTVKELSSKNLATDRRKFTALAVGLLPTVTELWAALQGKALADVHTAAAAPACDRFEYLRGLEPVVSTCVTYVKLLGLLLEAAPHVSLLEGCGLQCTGTLVSSLGELHATFTTLGAVAEAFRASRRPTDSVAHARGLTLAGWEDCEDGEGDTDGEEGGSGLGVIPCGALFVKLFVRVVKVCFAVFKAHPLALSASGAMRALVDTFVSWIVGSAPAVPDAVLQHAIPLLTRALDFSQQITQVNAASAEGEAALALSECLDLIENDNRFSLPSGRGGGGFSSSPQARLEYRNAGAAALAALHEDIFGVTSHDDWLSYCITRQFLLSGTDLQQWLYDSAGWVLDMEDRQQAENGVRGAAEALLLSLVSDCDHASSICDKLVQYAASTGAGVFELEPENASERLLAAEASHLAFGLAAADAVAVGVLGEEGLSAWVNTVMLPLLTVCGLGAIVTSLTGDWPDLSVAHSICGEARMPALAATAVSVAPAACGLLARRLLWCLSTSRAVLVSNLRLAAFHLCCLLLHGNTHAGGKVAVQPGIRIAAGLLCTALIDDCSVGAAPLDSPATLTQLSDATFAAATDLATSSDAQVKTLEILACALRKATPDAIALASESLLTPLYTLWMADQLDGSSSAGLGGGSSNSSLSSIRKHVLSVLITVIASIPFASPTAAAAIPPQAWTACMPFVSHAIDTRNPDEVFLARDGLELWRAVLETAPEGLMSSSALIAPLPLLVPLALRDSEHFEQLAGILAAYIIRAPERLLPPPTSPVDEAAGCHLGELVSSVCVSLLTNAPTRAIPAIYTAMDVALSQRPASAPVLLIPALSKLLLSVAKGQAMLRAAEAEDDVAAESARARLAAAFGGVATPSPHALALAGGGAPSSREIAASASGSPGDHGSGDDIPAQSDRTLLAQAACTLARAFLASPDSFSAVLELAASTSAQCLIACGILPEYVRDIHALSPPAFSEVSTLRLLVWCVDLWMDSFEDVACGDSISGSGSEGEISVPKMQAANFMWRNKLLSMAVLSAIVPAVSLLRSTYSTLSGLETHQPGLLACLDCGELDLLHDSACRVDAITALAAETMESTERSFATPGGSAVATAAARYMPAITDAPAKRRHGSDPRSRFAVAQATISGSAQVHEGSGNSTLHMLAAAHARRTAASHHVEEIDEPEPEEDGVESGGAGDAIIMELLAGVASCGTDYLSARHNAFLARTEIASDLRAVMLEKLAYVKDCLGEEVWGAKFASRVHGITLEKFA